MNNIVFRAATVGDNAYIKQMILDVLKEYDVQADLEYDDLDAVEFGLNKRRHYFVSEVDGVVVGSAVLTPEAGGCVKLTKLFLPSEFRGKGLGKAMLEHVVNFAKENGVKEIYLRTRDRYKEACALYESAGWARHPDPLPPPGAPVKYYLILSAA